MVRKSKDGFEPCHTVPAISSIQSPEALAHARVDLRKAVIAGSADALATDLDWDVERCVVLDGRCERPAVTMVRLDQVQHEIPIVCSLAQPGPCGVHERNRD